MTNNGYFFFTKIKIDTRLSDTIIWHYNGVLCLHIYFFFCRITILIQKNERFLDMLWWVIQKIFTIKQAKMYPYILTTCFNINKKEIEMHT